MQLLFRLVGRYSTDRTTCQLQPCCCSGLQKVACFGSCSETLKCFMSMWLFTLKCKAQNKINRNTFVLIVRKETWLAAFSVASVAAVLSPSLSLLFYHLLMLAYACCAHLSVTTELQQQNLLAIITYYSPSWRAGRPH